MWGGAWHCFQTHHIEPAVLPGSEWKSKVARKTLLRHTLTCTPQRWLRARRSACSEIPVLAASEMVATRFCRAAGRVARRGGVICLQCCAAITQQLKQACSATNSLETRPPHPPLSAPHRLRRWLGKRLLTVLPHVPQAVGGGSTHTNAQQGAAKRAVRPRRGVDGSVGGGRAAGATSGSALFAWQVGHCVECLERAELAVGQMAAVVRRPWTVGGQSARPVQCLIALCLEATSQHKGQAEGAEHLPPVAPAAPPATPTCCPPPSARASQMLGSSCCDRRLACLQQKARLVEANTAESE